MRYDYYESASDLSDIPRAWDTQNNKCLPHFHEGIELVYALEGSFTGAVNNQPVRVNAGEMLINGCYAVHNYDDVPCKSIIAIIPLNAVPSLSTVLTEKHFRDVIITDSESQPLLRLMRMLEEFDDNVLMKRGISYAILGYLMEEVGLAEFGSPGITSFLKDVLTYLAQHFRETLSVEQLATRFGYSTQRFNNLFREGIGYTLPKYVNTLRIRHAARLMMTTTKTMAEITAECGFSSPRIMDQIFREEFGTSPADYIKTHGGGSSAAVHLPVGPQGGSRTPVGN